MSELQILFDTELNVACVNKEKIIKVQPIDKDVLYKFIVGIDGIWKTIQDYSLELLDTNSKKYLMHIVNKMPKSQISFF